LKNSPIGSHAPILPASPTMDDCYLDHPYALAGRVIDPVSGNVSWQGKCIHLQRKDLEVLALLASNPGTVIARASFVTVVWNGNDLVGDRGVSDKIFTLRRALSDHDESQPIIRTIPRRGYQLSVAVQQAIALAPPAFEPGQAIAGSPGWRLQRQLSVSDVSESWLAQSEDAHAAPQVFSFCRSEAHLRRLQRETTLLRYLCETLGERKDFALVRDWQLLEPPYFLARDYCTHASLTAWATAVGGLTTQSVAERQALMLALTAAVASMHDVGVVHGQLDAASILLVGGDKKTAPQLKLSAFDLGALRDSGQLAALKITNVGLSFIDGIQAPTIAEDIYALGVLLLQLAVGDLAAKPGDSAALTLATNPAWGNLICQCFGPPEQRPSAAELYQLFCGDAAAPPDPAIPTSAAKLSPVPAHASLLGQSVGPYRLTDKLGEGGMGTVYLAEQRAPVQRQVAIKLIKAGMDTAEVLARFEAERQALAIMNHVNVAAVYDAGAAQSGRPYFAMEYVPGLDITAHCDEHEIDIRGRIALFMQVCDGVLHAHQKGIIHRDLKPSNILIKAAQGQAATAKIIDFGVAKSLQRNLGHLTAHTQLGSFVGTRTYSSPEQISGNIVALDTRTDTYSLGVVLYELLAGVTPFDEDVLAAKSPLELSKLISIDEPPPLLKRFISLEAKVEADIAACRKLNVAQMKQALSSDLAWIVAKCLERNPNDRYASVLELEKDLRRWLEGRPVEARPITWRYRIRKMVRRNWGKVAFGSAVALVLLISTTAAVVSYFRAETSRADAELVADFQSKQIMAIDPAIMGQKLREILLTALQQNEASANALPKTAAAAGEITSRLSALNMTDVALKQLDALYFEPALAAIERDFGTSPLLQARLKQSLAMTWLEIGGYEKAAKVLESTLIQRTKLLGSQHPLTLETRYSRALAYNVSGLAEQAEADYRTALAGMRQQLGVHDRKTLQTMQSLGELLLSRWRDKESLEVLTEAAKEARIAFGDQDEQTLGAIYLLSVVTFRVGRLDDAEKLVREAMEGERQLHGKHHKHFIQALRILADIVGARGSKDLAVNYNREALQTAEQLFGSKHISTLELRHNLALSLSKNDQLPEAIVLFRAVHNDMRHGFGAAHPDTLAVQLQLGNALRKSRQWPEAERLLAAALQIAKRKPSNFETLIFDAKFYLGLLAKDQGKFDQAERLLNESLDGRRRVAGETHMDIIDAKKALDELKQDRLTGARR
jgi:eukaryotic-like serine/threonine-protein kinase